MGFKDLFIKEEPIQQKLTDEADFLSEEKEDEYVEVDVSVVSKNNLITDIYDNNKLSDVSKSVFKVEELINSLPKEMPNETKKATVLQILTSFSLTVEEIEKDADARLSVIKSSLKKIEEDNQYIIDSNNAAIEQKKFEIQQLEKDNAERESMIKESQDKISSEIDRIIGLTTFLRSDKYYGIN